MDYEYWLLHLDPLINAVRHLKSFRPLCSRSVHLADKFYVKEPISSEWLRGKTISLQISKCDCLFARVASISTITKLIVQHNGDRAYLTINSWMKKYLPNIVSLTINGGVILKGDISWMENLRELEVWMYASPLPNNLESYFAAMVHTNIERVHIKELRTMDIAIRLDLSHIEKLIVSCNVLPDTYESFHYDRVAHTMPGEWRDYRKDYDLIVTHDCVNLKNPCHFIHTDNYL